MSALYPFQPVSGSAIPGGSGCVDVRAGDVAGVAGSFTPGSGLAGYGIEVFPRNVSCAEAWSGSESEFGNDMTADTGFWWTGSLP